MKNKFTTVKRIPNWAMSYFVNDDVSGLSDEDLELVKAYKFSLVIQGLELVSPIEGTENEFCAYPAFGLACDTTDWTARYI